jgi:hypothetical protein
MMFKIFSLKQIKILNNIELIYFMIIDSLYIGIAEKALPPVNIYSINYKWDLTLY